jgi:HSP20 family protein
MTESTQVQPAKPAAPAPTQVQPAKPAPPAPTQAAPVTPAPADFFDQVQAIYDSIAQRAFEIFQGNGGMSGRDWDNWFQAEAEKLHPVHIDVVDAGDSLKVRAEVPGFAAGDLNVTVEPDCLTITGKREAKQEKENEGKVVYSERCADEILRVIDLPADVDPAKVTATLKDGVLELAMPKAAPPKQIKVEPKVA